MKKTIDYHMHQIENLVSKAIKAGKHSVIYEIDMPGIGETPAEIIVRRLNEIGNVKATIVDLQEGLIAVEW